MRYRRQALAFLVTPVAAGILQTALLAIVSTTRGQRIETRYLGMLVLVMTVQAFAMIVIGGVPAWFMLRLFRKRSSGSFALAGAAIGIAGVLLRIALGFGVPPDAHLSFFDDVLRPVRLWEFAIMAIAGAGSALVFRAIAGLTKPDPATSSVN